MDEYIRKQAAIEEMDELNAVSFYEGNEHSREAYYEIKRAIRNLQPADVRPVILCRDCKHKGWIQEPCHGKSIDYCRALERPVDPLFFCGMGKRRDSDGKVC